MTGESGKRSLISPNNCRPSIPGMLMSDRMTITPGSISPLSSSKRLLARGGEMHDIGALARLAAEALAEHLGDIGLVIDNNDTGAHATLQRDCFAALAMTGLLSSLRGAPGSAPCAARGQAPRRSNLVEPVMPRPATSPRLRGEVGIGASARGFRVRGSRASPRAIAERPLTPTLSPQAGRGRILRPLLLAPHACAAGGSRTR